MVTVFVFERHTAADCPARNEISGKIFGELGMKGQELCKKHGIKFVGAWILHPEHLIIYQYDAPSMDAYIQLEREPLMVKWRLFTDAKFKMGITMEDAMKTLAAAAIVIPAK